LKINLFRSIGLPKPDDQLGFGVPRGVIKPSPRLDSSLVFFDLFFCLTWLWKLSFSESCLFATFIFPRFVRYSFFSFTHSWTLVPFCPFFSQFPLQPSAGGFGILSMPPGFVFCCLFPPSQNGHRLSDSSNFFCPSLPPLPSGFLSVLFFPHPNKWSDGSSLSVLPVGPNIFYRQMAVFLFCFFFLLPFFFF